MDGLIEYATSHQFTVIAVFLSICLIAYLFFGKFFKLALAIMLLFVGLCGYLYTQDSVIEGKSVRNIWESVKEKTLDIVGSSSGLSKGEGYISKGKKAKEDAVEGIFDSKKEKQEQK